MRKHQRRNTYDTERASAAAVRRAPSRFKRNPTAEEQAALEKHAKQGFHTLTAAEVGLIAQHPYLTPAKRLEWQALAEAA